MSTPAQDPTLEMTLREFLASAMASDAKGQSVIYYRISSEGRTEAFVLASTNPRAIAFLEKVMDLRPLSQKHL